MKGAKFASAAHDFVAVVPGSLAAGRKQPLPTSIVVNIIVRWCFERQYPPVSNELPWIAAPINWDIVGLRGGGKICG